MVKYSLLLFLLLPLTSFGQYNRNTYATPTMQRTQQSRDYFNRSMAQHQQDFQQRVQQRQLNRGYMHYSSNVPMSEKTEQQVRARQLQLEKEANEKLAQLAQELRHQRELHPATDAQQAATQQQQDERQLTKLAVTNYREVFLPGQVASAIQAQRLSAKGRGQFLYLHQTVSNRTAWKKQNGAQLPARLKACGDTLTLLTTDLLGFDPFAPPAVPAPFSASGLTAQLAAGVFDQQAATRLIQDAVLTEKLATSKDLVKAVKDFRALTAAVAAPAPGSNPRKLRKDVQESYRLVRVAMTHYYYLVGNQTTLDSAQAGLLAATDAYVKEK